MVGVLRAFERSRNSHGRWELEMKGREGEVGINWRSRSVIVA
jgi:hypothetical protein